MTWFSHIAVASSIGHIAGLNVPAMAAGAVVPDLVESVYPRQVKHRGLSHSLAINAVVMVLLWNIPYMRDVWLGVILGHLFLDALTPAGVPFFDENGGKATLFGGKIRTGSLAEFVFSGIFTFTAFVLLAPLLGQGLFSSSEGNRWWNLYQDGVIDLREYREKRFTLL